MPEQASVNSSCTKYITAVKLAITSSQLVCYTVSDVDLACTGEPPAPPTRLVSSWQKMLYGKEEVAMVHVLRVQRGKGPEGEEE